ncbi:Hpt domain-containing protein [Mesonia aestuariivivens]|uniref:Hpt domain-containing protein n=1 Tax=Mesonia aestuariivivens TaxID=2796128 RepID=A0ABS6W4U4_9FLAO|nr:Hpt domain-containing protein [Mesonia aestuariivivens]MBW2962875.1 Hpt domain-containing protein [Mesonia aestuariivivens]
MRTYNLDELSLMADGDEGFINEMVKTFIEELPEDVKAMNDAISNDNAILTYQVAHKMKPNLQMFGIDLSSDVTKLEQWSKANLKKEEILPHAQHVTNTITEVCKELEQDYKL